MQSSVVLINLFEVPAGVESDFLAWWKRSSDVLSKEPGFIDAKLHHSVSSEACFRFINIAHWTTADALDQARRRNQEVLQSPHGGKGRPALYTVAVEY